MIFEKSHTDERGGHHQFRSEGQVQRFDTQPTLDTLRKISRKHGDPLEYVNILEKSLTCSECGDEISSRFSATSAGHLVCWECAMSEPSNSRGGVARTTDPAKVVLSESGLYHKSLCDYVINVATGCTHGCKFCYVPSTPNITARKDMLSESVGVNDTQEGWGSYLLYRDDLPERLAKKLNNKQKWNSTERGRGVVMLSSGTDCYQDRRTAQITRGCIIELLKHRIPIRILTRSPAVCRDIDLFRKAIELSDNGMLLRIGSSIPSLNEDQVRAIEPNAPVPSARLDALQEISDAGVPVYVSMSPTYPTQNKDDFDELMRKFADLDPEVVFHEPINPRGGNFQMTIEAARTAGEKELASELEKLTHREEWAEYSIQQMNWAVEMGQKYGIDVHTWPDKQVISTVDAEKGQALREQRKKPSPEEIPNISLPT